MSALVALAVALTAELLRAVPAMVATRIGPGEGLAAGGPAAVLAGPFVAAAIVVLVPARRLPPRQVLLWAGVALGVGRLLVQTSTGDVQTAIAGLALGGGLVVLLLLVRIGLPLFGGGVVAGAGLAAALRIALGSRDLVWIEHPGATAAVAVIVAWFLVLLVARCRREVVLLGRSRIAALPLLAVGPTLLLEAFVLTNLGWVAPAIGRGWLGASVAIGVAGTAGLLAAALVAAAPDGPWRWAPLVGSVSVVALALAQAFPSLAWAPVVAIAQGGIGALLTSVSARGGGTGGAVPPARAAAWNPLFLLAAVVVLDGHGLLGFTIRPSAVVAACGIALAVAALAARRLAAPVPHHPGWRHVPSLAVVFVLPAALVLAGLPVLARAGGGGGAVDSRELRVVSYNVQLGFTDAGELNIEEVAAVLASLRPDVIALQEVPRGFLPAAGIDMIGWLQHALGMPHVAFQSSSPGALHGNAILSRHLIGRVATRSFPRAGTALPRGALAATVQRPGGPDVRVISAHLPPGGTTTDRDARVSALLDLWDGEPSTVVALDANARPGSTLMASIAEAGLVVPDDDTPTFPSRAPTARIDYVLHSDDLTAVVVEVPRSRASDHLPVLTVVRPADLV